MLISPQRSSGRGGLGNIESNSKSRSRSRAAIRSTGRGGAGNLQGGNADPEILAQLEEEERLRYLRDEGVYVYAPFLKPPRVSQCAQSLDRSWRTSELDGYA